MSGNLVKDARVPLGKAEQAAVADFYKDTLGRKPEGLCLCGGNIFAFDSDLPIPPFGVVAPGVAVGEARKGRITPHHHFFMAYGTELSVKVVLSPDDPSVAKYLAGEEIGVIPITAAGDVDKLTYFVCLGRLLKGLFTL